MGKPKSAVSAVREEAQQLDLRRQAQIKNQIQTINRLLAGATYDDILRGQAEDIADLQVRLDASEAENRRLQAEQAGED